MTEVQKKKSYWWLVILLVVFIGWQFYRNYIPMEDTTFAINSGADWYSCWSDSSDIKVSYEISSNFPVDLYFIPSKQEVENISLLTNFSHYPSCSSPSVLKNSGSCVISGSGCIVLVNLRPTEATVNLKYKAEAVNA